MANKKNKISLSFAEFAQRVVPSAVRCANKCAIDPGKVNRKLHIFSPLSKMADNLPSEFIYLKPKYNL